MTTSQNFSPKHPPRSARHNIHGIDYHVLEWGDPSRPPLVVLHGWGDCAASFQFLVDELDDDTYVVAPDWRGFGKTASRARSYWFPDYIADLHALLAIYSPDRPVDLLGHSMGANAAALYAGTFPERIRRFVNAEGFGLPDGDPADAPSNYRRWIERRLEAAGYATFGSFDDLAARIRKRSPSMPVDRARFVAEQWAHEVEGGRIELHADPAHKVPNPILYRRAEAAACWQAIQADVLLVMGDASEFGKAMADWQHPDPAERPFPGAGLVVIPDCGHMLHFEKPVELAQAVRAFLTAP